MDIRGGGMYVFWMQYLPRIHKYTGTTGKLQLQSQVYSFSAGRLSCSVSPKEADLVSAAGVAM